MSAITRYTLAVTLLFQAAIAGEIRIEKNYLHVPVAREGASHSVQLLDGAEVVRYFHVTVPASESDRVFWSSTDVAPWKGRNLELRAEPPLPAGFFEQSDDIRKPPNVYQEQHRPQFHFSPMAGWTNDPNGLTYQDGEYHLFFQHNPYGIPWGNMTWGHAVSRDLLHWEEIGDALYADRLGTIYSGSGVVDHDNTSGFGNSEKPPMVVFYTSAGSHSYTKQPFTQSMAYSTDNGRAWTKFARNPIIGNIKGSNRDPKVFWHEPSRQWVMALYLDRSHFVLMGSKNLREWEKLSDVDFPDGHECPEFFELPVDGNPNNKKWVFWEGAGRYRIGRFDGKTFIPETGVLPSEWGPNSYAGQTWNDTPDARRILITWMRSRGQNEPGAIYPGMPFNQQMSFPRVLSLRTTRDGIRLFSEPLPEISRLYEKRQVQSNIELAPGVNPLAQATGDLYDIDLELDTGTAKSITLNVRGTPITFYTSNGELTCLNRSVRTYLKGNRLDLRVLIDRTSLEIFTAGGRYVMSFCFRPEAGNHKLELKARGGTASVDSLKIRDLKSIWRNPRR